MGEKPDTTKLFHAEHNFRDSYSLSWLESRDAEARAALKKYRVRPVGRLGIQVSETGPGKSGYGMWPGQRVAHCLISSNAETKLNAAGLVCLEMLLD